MNATRGFVFFFCPSFLVLEKEYTELARRTAAYKESRLRDRYNLNANFIKFTMAYPTEEKSDITVLCIEHMVQKRPQLYNDSISDSVHEGRMFALIHTNVEILNRRRDAS